MLDILTKKDYWDFLDLKLISRNHHSIKNVQDGYILNNTYLLQNKKILEIGGGDSRIIKKLSEKNECWMIDKFEGADNGLLGVPKIDGVKVVQDFMGNFTANLLDEYFDCIFSISVIEHISLDFLESFFNDCARVLKPGGKMIHAIDINITDKDKNIKYEQIAKYLTILSAPNFSLKFIEVPKINEKVFYKCSYASNPNNQLYSWNLLNPTMTSIRQNYEGVSIKLEMYKV